MVNPFSEVNWNPDARERRRFAASLLIGFPCVAAVLLLVERWRGADWSFGVPLAMGAAGVALGLILMVVPQIARPFHIGWHVVAAGAGFVLGNVVLAAVYLLMFAPVGLALRAIGRSSLSKGFDRSAPSYWRDAQTPGEPERYYRQY